MFEDSLLESSGALTRRSWPTALSFAAQFVAGAVLVLLSLFYTRVLPHKQLMSLLEAPAPPVGAPPTHNLARVASRSGSTGVEILTPPPEVPKTVAVIHDEGTGTVVPKGIAGDILGSVSDGSIGTVMNLLRNSPPGAPKVAAQKVRVSTGVAEGMLIRQVKPEYPSLAQQARIQGLVVLQATIGKDGSIENLRVISGHPMLAPAAIDAVKQWRYKPYYLNGEPVEVETYINVDFTMGGG